MMRFLGVLVGSALAVAALVVFVGIPEFTTESSVPEPTVITLPMRADAPDPVAEEGPDEPPPPAAIDTPAAPAAAEAPADTPAQTPAEQLAEQPAAEPAEPLHWYAFWSPFRSEVAANGFVDQLQRVTGLDYRVVKVKPGVYEVAFAYEDDQEITANLTQISAATGLQLPES
jgi:uncharacterized membrane protein